MRVAVIKSYGHIDVKIERLLTFNKIKGDFITKFTRIIQKIMCTTITTSINIHRRFFTSLTQNLTQFNIINNINH